MASSFIWQGVHEGATIRVETASRGWRRIRLVYVNDAKLAESIWRRSDRDLLVDVQLDGREAAHLRVTIQPEGSVFESAARRCTATWNSAPVTLQVLRGRWLSMQPVWVRALFVSMFVSSIAFMDDMPARYRFFRVMIPLLLVFGVGRLPSSRTLPRT